MRSKLAVLVFVGVLFSLPCALAQTEPETAADSPAVVKQLRREIAELKQRIAELEAKVARLETIERRLLRDEQRMRRMDGWERLPGSYLRFPIEVERAMMGDSVITPRWKEQMRSQPEFLPEALPQRQRDPLPPFELPEQE